MFADADGRIDLHRTRRLSGSHRANGSRPVSTACRPSTALSAQGISARSKVTILMSDFGRRLFLASAIVLVLPGTAFARTIVPSVLFVCQAGTAKSAIARELLRRRARERGIAVTVFSRGLAIENHVSASLKKRLDADAIDTRRDGFRLLSASDLRNADIVVSFTPLPPSYRFSRAKDWSAVPSVNDAYVLARAEMDRRIEQLLDNVEAGQKAKR